MNLSRLDGYLNQGQKVLKKVRNANHRVSGKIDKNMRWKRGKTRRFKAAPYSSVA